MQKIFEVTSKQEFDKKEFTKNKLDLLVRKNMYKYDEDDDKIIIEKISIKEEVAA